MASELNLKAEKEHFENSGVREHEVNVHVSETEIGHTENGRRKARQ